MYTHSIDEQKPVSRFAHRSIYEWLSTTVCVQFPWTWSNRASRALCGSTQSIVVESMPRTQCTYAWSLLSSCLAGNGSGVGGSVMASPIARPSERVDGRASVLGGFCVVASLREPGQTYMRHTWLLYQQTAAGTHIADSHTVSLVSLLFSHSLTHSLVRAWMTLGSLCHIIATAKHHHCVRSDSRFNGTHTVWCRLHSETRMYFFCVHGEVSSSVKSW